MHIGRPSITDDGKNTFYRVNISLDSSERELWYSVPINYASFLSDTADAALVALLFPAMASGENITVEGSLSEELFYNLSTPVQVILRQVFPALQKVKIEAREWAPNRDRADGVVTGFSGGVDSFCVLADHHYSNEVPESYKLTHLLFSNVGSHGAGGERLFMERYARVESVAQEIGLPIIPINSNLDSFYIDLGFEFIDTYTPRNASVAHLLSNGIGRYYFASTYGYQSIAVGELLGGLARCEPVLLPLFGTKWADLKSTGSEYTRVEKTVKIASIEDTHKFLDVCVKANLAQELGKVNCSICWKCMNTMVTLEIAGQLYKYAHIFDLDFYRKYRNRYLANIIYDRDKDPETAEIVEYARSQNFKFPLSATFLSYSGLYRVIPHLERADRVGRRLLKKDPPISFSKYLY